MTTRDDETPLAELAAQALADEPAALPGPFDDRSGHVAAIEQALRSRARRRWVGRRAGIVALVVAAPAAAMVARFALPSRVTDPGRVAAGVAPPAEAPSPARAPARAVVEAVVGSIDVEGARSDLGRGDEIAAGMRLRGSQGGRFAIALRTGTRLTLVGGAAIRVDDLGTLSRFELGRGSLEAQVAKLAPGNRFVVVTPDAEIEVKGTRFEVAVSPASPTCEPRTQTSVAVQQGVVAVRFGGRELRLTAGDRWPDCHQPRAAIAPARRSPVPTGPRPLRQVARASKTVPPASLAPPSSTLAEQNDLLAAALAAERRGDLEEAQRWLDRLMSRFPDGQLADSARAAVDRLAKLRRQKASQ